MGDVVELMLFFVGRPKKENANVILLYAYKFESDFFFIRFVLLMVYFLTAPNALYNADIQIYTIL